MGASTLYAGRYEVLRRLAIGGMGELHLARQLGIPGFERLVAIKQLLPALTEDPAELQQFLDEARVLATLNHPNIVSVLELGQHEGQHFLVMEYIAGINVEKVAALARKSGTAVPPRVAAAIGRDVALALAHAHAAADAYGRPLQLVHRDVSPQNVMVRHDGVVKVVDFGVAKAANRLTHTQGNILKGKPRYMSPEQLCVAPLDGRSDQYSLGVVLYELLSGTVLFDAEGIMALYKQVVGGRVPPLHPRVPECPPALSSVVMRMISVERDHRFRDCLEVANALQRLLDATGGSAEAEVRRFIQDVGGGYLKDRCQPIPGGPRRVEIAVLSSPVVDAAFEAPRPMAPPAGAPPALSVEPPGPEDVARHILEQARTSTGGCAVLLGAPGSGKSHALKDLARTAADLGFAVRNASVPTLASAIAEPRAHGPRCILLDDLHTAGSKVNALLEHFLQQARGKNLVLFAAASTGVQGSLPSAVVPVMLAPRSDACIRAVVSAQLGGAHVPPDFLRAILMHASGSPGLAQTITRCLLDEGTLCLDEGHYRVAEGAVLRLPGTLDEAHSHRIMRQPPHVRAVLRVAARFSGVITRGAVEAEFGAAAAGAIARAVAAGILERVGDAQFAFSQGSLREVLIRQDAWRAAATVA